MAHQGVTAPAQFPVRPSMTTSDCCVPVSLAGIMDVVERSEGDACVFGADGESKDSVDGNVDNQPSGGASQAGHGSGDGSSSSIGARNQQQQNSTAEEVSETGVGLGPGVRVKVHSSSDSKSNGGKVSAAVPVAVSTYKQ